MQSYNFGYMHYASLGYSIKLTLHFTTDDVHAEGKEVTKVEGSAS